MDEKYKDPTDSSVQPIHMDINKDFSDDEDDLEIIFVDDDVE